MARIQDIDIPHLEFGEAAAPGTPASGIVRLYAKTDGLLYSKDDAGAETVVTGGGGAGVTPAYARAKLSGGDFTTSSTSFADVTGATVTFTTTARPVHVCVLASGYMNNTAATACLDVAVDGTREGGTTNGLLTVSQHATVSEGVDLSFCFDTAALTAASHTIKLQARVINGAHQLTLNAADPVLIFSCHEIV